MQPPVVRARDVAVLAGGLAASAVVGLVLRSIPGVNHTTSALVLLLVVLATATYGRLSIAIAVAVAGTFAFNFFFLPPVGTLFVADPQNWVALVAFLTVAVIASQLSASVQARARERAEFLAEREAAELVRQKAEVAETLLASISHDFKTPLTAIAVAVANLAGDLSVDERRAQGQAASGELARLTRLIQDILEMARIDAAAIRVEAEWVTPADVVDAAAAHVRHELDGRELVVDADADHQVEIDPRVASMALSHLLENAARYSPSDTEITIDARARPEGLRVSVSDRGPGLDLAEREQLFERFFRGQRAREAAPGSGMGLAITRGLLAALGGQVWAEGAPGGGARFTITVPGRRRPGPVGA